VRRFVDTGYRSAVDILSGHREVLERIAKALLEREVLDAQEIKMVIDGKQLPNKPAAPHDEGVQQVLKPEPGRAMPKPGERPAPA
jgi:cell division protease FtsH